MILATGSLRKKAVFITALLLIALAFACFIAPVHWLVISAYTIYISYIAYLLFGLFIVKKFALASAFFILVILALKVSGLLDILNISLAAGLFAGIIYLIK